MSSKITSLLMVSALAFVIGCGKKDDDKGDKKKNDGLVNTTDYRACTGPAAVGTTIFNRGWTREGIQGSVKITQTFYVGNGVTTVRQSCSINGIGASMDVQTQSSVVGNRLTVNEAEATFSIDMGDGSQLDCHVVVGALNNAIFKFEGPCLHLTNNDGVEYRFIPSNYGIL